MSHRYRAALEALRDMMEALGERKLVGYCNDALRGRSRAMLQCGFAIAAAMRLVRLGAGATLDSDRTPDLRGPRGTP